MMTQTIDDLPVLNGEKSKTDPILNCVETPPKTNSSPKPMSPREEPLLKPHYSKATPRDPRADDMLNITHRARDIAT